MDKKFEYPYLYTDLDEGDWFYFQSDPKKTRYCWIHKLRILLTFDQQHETVIFLRKTGTK